MAGAENPLVVFISSVMDKRVEDLSKERDAAIGAVSSMRVTRPWAFELAPASADPVAETYLDKVEECDIFVVILGAELTDPVENEYARAARVGKRKLLFVKNVGARSERAKAWLADRSDVKYARFEGPSDLEEQVLAAVADELIKSHRQLNLRDEDFKQLATSLTSQPVTFMVRTIEGLELKEITETFPDLEALYPNFTEWIDTKIVDIRHGTASAFLARYGQENAGFALVVDKGDKVRKLATLYMKPRYQGLGVGPRLLYGVIEQAARDGIEKLYVTVSDERREQLEGLLHQFGFFVEGVAGRRYRRDSWEWVWSKRLIHGVLRQRDLEKFVRRLLLEERGLVARRIRTGLYQSQPRYAWPFGSQQAAPSLVVGVSRGKPTEDYRRAERVAADLNAHLAFFSIEPLEGLHDDDDITHFDALDLEAMFFPLYVERTVDGLIIPIQQRYAQGLIPRSDQTQFLEPTRVQLRTDNVYYRYPTAYSGLGRGSSLFFYETHRALGESRLVGESKLLEYAVGQPEELLIAFGRLGVYRLQDLREAAMGKGKQMGKALALRFDWYREISTPLTIQQIRQVMPTFDPRTARRLDFRQATELRRLAGWNVEPLSFR